MIWRQFTAYGIFKTYSMTGFTDRSRLRRTPLTGIKIMSLRILSMFAAVFLLAACETAPTDTGKAVGTGASAVAGAGAGAGAGVGRGLTTKPGSQEDLVVNVGDRVFFEFDKYNLKADARKTLQRQTVWLKKYPANAITVQGHCDERGTREYNLALGERRANSVKNYLIALGINPNRIKTISYGKERPAVAGSNKAAWAQNRRGVTVVSQPGT